MDDDDEVLIQFQVSQFGWQPVLTTWGVWQEIYDFYQDPEVLETCEPAEICDNEGQTIDVNLVDAVSNAIVVKETLGVSKWIEMADSYDFWVRICLDPVEDAWVIHNELSIGVSGKIDMRGGEVDYCRVESLATSVLKADLKGHSIYITYSISLGEIFRTVDIDGVIHRLKSEEPGEEIDRLLDALNPVVKSKEEINLRPVYADEEAKVELDDLANFTAGD